MRAGWSKSRLSFDDRLNPLGHTHTFPRTAHRPTGYAFGPVCSVRPSQFRRTKVFNRPAVLFGVSRSRRTVRGLPFDNTRAISSDPPYRVLPGHRLPAFAMTIRLWTRNPRSWKYNRWRQVVPVSEPFTISSCTTQVTTPPGAVTRHSSRATASKSNEWSPYFRRLS